MADDDATTKTAAGEPKDTPKDDKGKESNVEKVDPSNPLPAAAVPIPTTNTANTGQKTAALEISTPIAKTNTTTHRDAPKPSAPTAPASASTSSKLPRTLVVTDGNAAPKPAAAVPVVACVPTPTAVLSTPTQQATPAPSAAKAVPCTVPSAEKSTMAAAKSTAAPGAAATVASTTAAAKAPSKRPPPVPKKRPYRRTKRPKNYCDKSTVTTTTPVANTPINVYDAVLGEANDLLHAAMEAQALGRLRMAHAYQLLLHARLVGLGKRFDRAQVSQPPNVESSPDVSLQSAMTESPSTSNASTVATPNQVPSDATAPSSGGSGQSKRAARPPVHPNVQQQIPVGELKRYLPANIEMDSAMIEHLARAAVELHHKRTGRKMAADGLLASPINGFISSPKKEKAVGVAWTAEEKAKVQKAAREGKDAATISKLIGTRTAAQVKAYLKTTSELEKGTAAVEKEMEETPRKRGGRGRKPPTTAMNTVPNANLNARALLQGKGL